MEEKIQIEVPYTNKPEDVSKLLSLISTGEVPQIKIDIDYIKSMGFTTKSSSYLLKILKMLEFIDNEDRPSSTWLAYASDENKGSVLGSAIKKAYSDLFKAVLCPYLESDDTIMDYLKSCVKGTPREMQSMVDTFRVLSELADFQDILCQEGTPNLSPSALKEGLPSIKVNPNLQINVQVHIDPATPDDKIETIFKNMQKYLLGKEEQN